MSIIGGIQRRLRDYRCRFVAATQSNGLRVETGRLVVTTFYDVEGDYAIAGKHAACFSALHRIAEVEAEVGIRSTYNVVAQLAAEAPDLFRDMQRAGHEIASHSLDHRVLTRLSATDRRDSIYRARDTFDRLGLDVIGHRSPQSSWSFSVVSMLKSAGYQWNAENDPSATPYVISAGARGTDGALWRMPVAMDDWWYEGAGLKAEEVLARWQSGIAAAQLRGGYLAIGFHPWVEDPGERFAAFREFMRWLAKRPGVQVMPFRQVMADMAERKAGTAN